MGKLIQSMVRCNRDVGCERRGAAQAAQQRAGGGRTPMTRRVLLAPMLSALLLALTLPVQAGDGGQAWAQDRSQRDRQFAPPQRRDEWRDPRRDEGRMPPQYPQRMSPDERRQLRRDLHDANRDMRPGRGDYRR